MEDSLLKMARNISITGKVKKISAEMRRSIKG